MNLGSSDESTASPAPPGLPDRWIRSRAHRMLTTVRESFEAYRLDLAAKALYEFTWHEFCDWYLELAKPSLRAEAGEARQVATRATLREVLDALLRALHPIMPFITEELWQQLESVSEAEHSIMLQPFPVPEDFALDEQAEGDMEWVTGFILGLRQIRGEMDIAPGRALPVLLQGASQRDRELLEQHRAHLELARIESLRVLADDEAAPPAATALLGDMKILVPMSGLIDVEAERARLAKRKEKIERDLARSEGKLANAKFVNNAPGEVVDLERKRSSELRAQRARLDEQLARIEALR